MDNSKQLELASELAHNSTVDELKDLYSEDELYKDDNGCKIYKDEVQDIFNRWYTYYLDIITEILN